MYRESLKNNMTQIKIFTEKTYNSKDAGPKAPVIDDLQKKVNDFLAENAGKIVVKDIKYSVQSPNPHQILNLNIKEWIIMVIYETL
jgi:hypothetical protein